MKRYKEMNDYKYYDTEGQLISQDRYIELYNKIYFYANDYKLEQKIEKIYNRDNVINSQDLISFLRWKVGDKSLGTDIITQYGQHIDTNHIKALANDIVDSYENNNIEDLYKIILQHHIKNLGAVYTLAIISVITKGKEPIYDKFAEIALDVIIGNHAFRDSINYNEMPDKRSVSAVFERYNKYKEKLKKVFNDSWKNSRDIDRALWTYGHMFSQGKCTES